MIKWKLIEVFVFLFKFAEKTENDKTEVDFVFRSDCHGAEVK